MAQENLPHPQIAKLSSNWRRKSPIDPVGVCIGFVHYQYLRRIVLMLCALPVALGVICLQISYSDAWLLVTLSGLAIALFAGLNEVAHRGNMTSSKAEKFVRAISLLEQLNGSSLENWTIEDDFLQNEAKYHLMRRAEAVMKAEDVVAEERKLAPWREPRGAGSVNRQREMFERDFELLTNTLPISADRKMYYDKEYKQLTTEHQK